MAAVTHYARSAWQAATPRHATPWSHEVLGFTIHWCGFHVTGNPLTLVQRLQSDAFGEGYSDVEYNWFVALDGSKIEGRGWDVESGANGASKFGASYANDHYLAICVLAGPGNSITPVALQSLAELIHEGAARRRLARFEVVPHRHWHATACPGDELTNWIAADGWRLAPVVSNEGLDMEPDALKLHVAEVILELFDREDTTIARRIRHEAEVAVADILDADRPTPRRARKALRDIVADARARTK